MNSVHVDDWIPGEQTQLAIEFFVFESENSSNSATGRARLIRTRLIRSST